MTVVCAPGRTDLGHARAAAGEEHLVDIGHLQAGLGQRPLDGVRDFGCDGGSHGLETGAGGKRGRVSRERGEQKGYTL